MPLPQSRNESNMLAALLKHIALMFIFRHDGTGLPARGPLPWLFLAAATVTTATRGALDLHDPITAAVFAVIGVAVLVYFTRRDVKLLGAIAMNCIGGDVVAILLTLYGFPQASILMTVWQVASMLALASKMKRVSEPS